MVVADNLRNVDEHLQANVDAKLLAAAGAGK
jgi:hypothetical protein